MLQKIINTKAFQAQAGSSQSEQPLLVCEILTTMVQKLS